MPIERVFVAGAGLMGHGIGQVHAAIGKHVVLYEPDLARAQAGRERIAGNLERALAKGKIDSNERDVIVGRIVASDDLELVRSADLVIEAVFEDVDVKRGLWKSLDERAPEGTIFASNTSSISIDSLAEALAPSRRERFVGMHFFSPVPVMPLVELIRGSATSDATEQAIREVTDELGKKLIVSADRPGFIVNRLLMPMLAEAMRILEEGSATAADIDTGAKVGLNHPMGPLELADFIGLDTVLSVMQVLYEGLADSKYRPCPLLVKYVEAGWLGRKTQRGFYDYRGEKPVPTR
jgi:3-hydroxybutyryl-CoA dehydrogenase